MVMRAAVRHRFARVVDEMPHGLNQPRPIRADRRQARRAAHVKRRVFVEPRQQPRPQIRDERREIHHLRRQHLPPAEREKLIGQRRRSLGGHANRVHRIAPLMSGGQFLLQPLDLPANHEQQVVEVVGDAAGEPADRGEPHRRRHRFGTAGDVRDATENRRIVRRRRSATS